MSNKTKHAHNSPNKTKLPTTLLHFVFSKFCKLYWSQIPPHLDIMFLPRLSQSELFCSPTFLTYVTRVNEVTCCSRPIENGYVIYFSQYLMKDTFLMCDSNKCFAVPKLSFILKLIFVIVFKKCVINFKETTLNVNIV